MHERRKGVGLGRRDEHGSTAKRLNTWRRLALQPFSCDLLTLPHTPCSSPPPAPSPLIAPSRVPFRPNALHSSRVPSLRWVHPHFAAGRRPPHASGQEPGKTGPIGCSRVQHDGGAGACSSIYVRILILIVHVCSRYGLSLDLPFIAPCTASLYFGRATVYTPTDDLIAHDGEAADGEKCTSSLQVSFHLIFG